MKDNKTQLEEIEKDIAIIERGELKVLKEKRSTLSEELDLERRKSLMGKCFVYKNNTYSCPKKKEDYWDTYYKVIDINDWGIDVLLIDIDSDKKIRIDTKEDSYSFYEDHCESCSEEEFDKFYLKVTSKIQELCNGK